MSNEQLAEILFDIPYQDLSDYQVDKVEAVEKLLVEAKIEELDWALHASHGGQQPAGEIRIKRDELQQSLKDAE